MIVLVMILTTAQFALPASALEGLPVAEVEAIFRNLREVFDKPGATKADVVEVLKDYLPDFHHIEKGKSLDNRM